jgi:hypothetical protein
MAEDRTRESQLWAWMLKGLKPFGLHAHVSRVENSAEVGYPDVEGCIMGRSLVVELKVAYEHAEGRVEVKITRAQAYFLHGRSRAGGRAWLLVRLGRDRHYLIPGSAALEIFDLRKELTRGLLEIWGEGDPSATHHQIWNTAVA